MIEEGKIFLEEFKWLLEIFGQSNFFTHETSFITVLLIIIAQAKILRVIFVPGEWNSRNVGDKEYIARHPGFKSLSVRLSKSKRNDLQCGGNGKGEWIETAGVPPTSV